MPTDQRGAFAAEIARLAKRYKSLGRIEATTKNGYAILLTGMAAGHVDAITITDPDGHQIRRADGWEADETAEVAAFLWDLMQEDRTRAAERERLTGLKSVSITSADASGSAAGKETSRYLLTPDQLAQLRLLAERSATANATTTA